MTASINYVQDAFRKLSFDSNPSITVRQEQEQEVAVNSLINGRNVYAVMPTGLQGVLLFNCSLMPWS